MPKSKKVNKSSNNSVKKEVKKKEVKTTTSAKKTTAKPKAKTQDKNKKWFKEFKAELKKIIWPSRSELLENSVVVISMVLLVAGIIFVLDLAFKSLSSAEIDGAKKLKESITANTTQNETASDESGEQSNEIDVSNSEVNDIEAVWTDSATENNE